jgi:spermidine/putrescine transport system substrate-binding protein
MWLKLFLVLFCLLLLAAACTGDWQPTPTPAAPEPLVVLGWPGYLTQDVLDAFTEEHGVPIQYLNYADQEEALARLRAGEALDVVVLGDAYIPVAVDAGLLAELDFSNIPNFHNLGPNFRDLAYDPENRFSIMFQWGTTGLIVRTDRTTRPVTAWADLWNPAYAGKIGVWPFKEELIGIALKTLGYSINSTDPAELRAAGEKLRQLGKRVYLLDPQLATGAEHLLDDHTVMIYGWSYDALVARRLLPDVEYVIPAEGTVIWSDSVTIPANSRRKEQAEQFINFLLRPEISAQLVNELWIPSPNEAARPYIKPEVLYNPLVYPPMSILENAEFYTEVSAETQRQYEQIWKQFLAEGELAPHP